MDLQRLANQTRVPLRKLRYVLDHRLLPGLRVKHSRDFVGHPRSFAEHEGFGLACAAALVEAGVRRETVILFMDALCSSELESRPRRRIPTTALMAAFVVGADPALATVGDGAVIRFQIAKYDSGWIEPKAFAKLSDFSPRVTIQIDLAQLRKAVREPRPGIT